MRGASTERHAVGAGDEGASGRSDLPHVRASARARGATPAPRGAQEERPAPTSARTASAVGTSVTREVNSPALAPARIEGALPRPAARAIVEGIARSVSHG